MDAHHEAAQHEAAARSELWALDGAARKPVPELVGDKVLELVRAGELRRGDRLPNEPELARILGVGRSSVRTALQRLQVLGVVEVNRGRGWFVAGEPRQQAAEVLRDRVVEREFDVLDLLEVRMALEGQAAALAATRATPGQLDEIAKLSRAHQEAPFDDREALLETDEAFHAAIVDASGNAYLQLQYAMLTPLIADWRRESFSSPQVHDRSGLDHNQIVVQIRRRDEVGARLTMITHLMGLYKTAQRESSERAQGERAQGERAQGERLPAEVATYVDVRDQPVWSNPT